ncbi:hypothetical protein D920_00932 [Enterococcus faecalis 13-SD-W-01]|nr:hypothetical protein D920_00932 [Enterococcus faecalis 13-SD-W-01]
MWRRVYLLDLSSTNRRSEQGFVFQISARFFVFCLGHSRLVSFSFNDTLVLKE